MDPASLSNLDPKLRETYERVMGTSTAPAAGQPTAPSSTPPENPVPNATTPPIDSLSSSMPDSLPDTMPTSDELSTPPLAASPLPQEQQPETVTISQPLPNPTSFNQIVKPHGHSGLIRVFYILGGVVFFVIYAFLWVKIFNIKLPF